MADWKIKGYRVLDIINPIKWYSIFTSIMVNKYSSTYSQVHVVEQLMYRFLNCSNCLAANKCIGDGTNEGCGCVLPDKMVVLWETDHLGKWGPVMGPKEWEEYKKRLEVKFTLTEKQTI